MCVVLDTTCQLYAGLSINDVQYEIDVNYEENNEENIVQTLDSVQPLFLETRFGSLLTSPLLGGDIARSI